MSRRMKKELDKVIGKDKIFTREDKQAIYTKIQESHAMKSRKKRKWGVPLVYGLTAALLIVIVGTGIHHHQPVEKASSVQKKQLQQSFTLGASKKSFSNQPFTFYNKQQKEIAAKYPDKINIVKKMYNSWDNIQNAQGEFVRGDSKGNKTISWFNLDLSHHKNLGKAKIYQNGKLVQTTDLLYKNNAITWKLENKNIYTVQRKKDMKNPGDTFGLYQFNEITHPEWWILIFNDYKDWDYKIGEKFGMPVYEISGTIPKTVSTNIDGRFTMIVSKNTGVLLGLKCYGHQNKPILYFTVKNIKINQGIPANVFNLNVSGYKKVSWDQFIKSTVGYVVKNKTGGK